MPQEKKTNTRTRDLNSFCAGCGTLKGNPCLCADLRYKLTQEGALGGSRAVREFRLDKYIVGPGNSDGFKACLNFRPTFENIFLYGPVGAGKDHLSRGAARLFLNRAPICKSLEQICEAVNACDDFYDKIRIFEKHISAQILVLSDVASEPATEGRIYALYKMLDQRWMEDRNGLIITSNLNLNDLAKWAGSDRISSRIAGLCKDRIIKIEGQDRRAE